MNDCICLECCEVRAARDEDHACAQMYDYSVELHQRARKDLEQSTGRLRRALVARDAAHKAGAA